MARKNNRRKRKPKQVYLIVVDGQTEKWYFQLMKQHENLNIDIKPELSPKKQISEQFEYVREMARIYDKVFWILDFDTVLKEDKETKKGTKSKATEFNEYKSFLENNFDNVAVFINSPCLEFWYLLHYKYSAKHYSTCNTVVKQIKSWNLLHNYKKTEKYYKQKK